MPRDLRHLQVALPSGHELLRIVPQNRRLANKKSIPRSIAWETVLSVMIDTKEYTRKLISLCRYSYEST
jgi:hypothetical protein